MDLEKYISQNREELDFVEKPDIQNIWKGLRKEIDDSVESPPNQPLAFSRSRVGWIVGFAASLALTIGIGLGYLMNGNNEEAPVNQEFNLSNYSAELASEAQNYQQLVTARIGELKLQNIDKEEYKEIFEELDLLDREYAEWTKDVPQYIHQQELIDYLTKHYERKIRILEILSKEIEKKALYEKREINM